jgi:aminoglycoside phosphotransferase (APT) family kinase protein
MAEYLMIGRGRAADVFDIGNGRVLRRYRTPHPGVAEQEALAMRHLRAHGAPVPEVFSAEGDEIVMQRLEGRSMLDTLRSKPWKARAIGRQLAELQRRIHAVSAGQLSLPRLGEGDSLLHFDLHPDNVMLTPDGPVVIDWSNVVVGDPVADVMFSWMIMVTSVPDDVPLLLRPILRHVRRNLTEGFIGDTAIDDHARRCIAEVCARRLLDPNCRPAEQVTVRAFAAQHAS